jgi:copper chaperone CopZ
MKTFALFIVLIAGIFNSIQSLGQVPNAQVEKVTLQASGLTCSMCSNAINKALSSLEFVQNIEPNIQNSSFEISFRQGARVDFDQLKKKVEDAGFFVSNLTASINFDHVELADDSHLVVGGNTIHFVNSGRRVLDGPTTIHLLDKGFVSSREYKKNSQLSSMECYKTGVASACCSRDGLKAGTRIFHATI